MNFGYKNGCLFFHCSKEGKKIDIIKKNNNVCFEVDINHRVINTGAPCEWSTSYASVIGYGKVSVVKNTQRKKEALNCIVDHYSPGTHYDYKEDMVKKVHIMKIKIDHMTGKKSE